jgi:hypothetical protein
VKRCPLQGKKKYRTQGEAFRVAIAESGKHGVMLRTYRCQECGFWHLTKGAKRFREERRGATRS